MSNTFVDILLGLILKYNQCLSVDDSGKVFPKMIVVPNSKTKICMVGSGQRA